VLQNKIHSAFASCAFLHAMLVCSLIVLARSAEKQHCGKFKHLYTYTYICIQIYTYIRMYIHVYTYFCMYIYFLHAMLVCSLIVLARSAEKQHCGKFPHLYTYTHICIQIYTYIRMYIHVYTYFCMYTHRYTCTYIHIPKCTYTYICIHLHACICESLSKTNLVVEHLGFRMQHLA